MTFLTHLAQLALIGWLPGAALFRLPWLDRERRAALDAEERAFWYVILSVSVSLSIVLALAVAHRYSFNRLLIADSVITLGCVALTGSRIRFGSTARRATWTALLPAVLV